MFKYLELQCQDTRIWLTIEAPDTLTHEQLQSRVKTVACTCSLQATPKAVFEFVNELSSAYNDWKISVTNGAFLEPVIFTSTRKKKEQPSIQDGAPRKRRGRKPASARQGTPTDEPKDELQPIPPEDAGKVYKQCMPPRDVVAGLLKRQAERQKELYNDDD